MSLPPRYGIICRLVQLVYVAVLLLELFLILWNYQITSNQRVCSDVVINVFIYRQNHILLRDKTFYAGMGWYLQ